MKIKVTAKTIKNKELILKLFDSWDNCVPDYLQDLSDRICNIWQTAVEVLEALKTVKNNNLSKAELESLQEIKERLFRSYSITTELFVGYPKIDRRDKWEYNFAGIEGNYRHIDCTECPYWNKDNKICTATDNVTSDKKFYEICPQYKDKNCNE